MKRFRRKGEGVKVHLAPEERTLLRDLAPQLRSMLGDRTDPALRRLFPGAYENDPERDLEYRLLMHDQLTEERLAALAMLEETADNTTLDEEQTMAWMGVLNDLRLVLGTRLDVSEETEPPGPDDPRAQEWAVYQYLTFLQDQLVDALAE